MVSTLTKIVFATKNKHKVSEVRELLKGTDIEIVEVEGEFNPEETGETFEENAYIKAFEAARMMNMPALADDSGLVVDALGGRPGVYSSRYEETDEKRINKLLHELENVAAPDRTARFVCAMVVVSPDGEKLFSTTGVCEGEIAFSPSGEMGFGYDPVFYFREKDVTMAELPMEEKNEISHRGKALRKTVEWLKSAKTK
jgi:XTP/dITP diphosphohydrolase